jgi:hypothetical protein
MSFSKIKKERKPKPWLRKIEYTAAVLNNGNLVYGYTDENGNFIEDENGIDIKTETRTAFFEHWGVDFTRPDVTTSQLVQITVAFIVDENTGEVIKVTDMSAIRFL